MNGILNDILIVDDTPDNLRLLTDLLKDHYRLRQALNGEIALQSIQVSAPDLILLDIMMPGINGYAVCQRLKSDTRTQHIPIIFLSAKENEIDKVTAFEVGGSDYIAKPFQAAEVLARIEHHLELSQLQQQLQQQNQQLQVQNQQLQQEVRDRLLAESALQSLNQQLEFKVQERTQQLQQALDKEHHLNDLQSRLLSTLSHELRTPLSIIVTSTELLKRQLTPHLTPNHERQFQRVNDSIQRITQLLENASLLVLLDSHTLSFEPTLTDLPDLCRQLIRKCELTIATLNPLSLEIVPDLPEVAIDPYLFRQLFINLIANAQRYSPEKSAIKVKLFREPQDLCVQIQDQGIGIPVSEQSRIYERFYRASNANSIPGTPGTGLGLAVVSEIIKLHQGTITITSELEQGTDFTLRFPLQAG